MENTLQNMNLIEERLDIVSPLKEEEKKKRRDLILKRSPESR